MFQHADATALLLAGTERFLELVIHRNAFSSNDGDCARLYAMSLL
jgi:hypothetical protein